MIHEITIPTLGEDIAEAQIVEWPKNEGSEISEGEVILVVQTDKAALEIESPQSGYLHIIGTIDQTCQIDELVGWIAQTQQEYLDNRDKSLPSTDGAPPATAESIEAAAATPAAAPPQSQTQRVSVSPAARAVARKHGLDLATIEGSGAGGRIGKGDVLKAIEDGEDGEKSAAPAGRQVDGGRKKTKKIVPISGIRRITHDTMHRSLQETAQITITMEADADELVRFRSYLIDSASALGVKISYNAILIRALALALKEHPEFNASSDGQSVTMWESINIGLAMDMPDGLIVPVIHDADRKSLPTVQKEIEGLADKARARKLSSDEITGGTFTLTNMGSFDVEAFTPILNPPEVGILGVGKIIEKPVAVDGEIKLGRRMMLSLTFDHRLVDGAAAARFLKTVRNHIEQSPLLTDLK